MNYMKSLNKITFLFMFLALSLASPAVADDFAEYMAHGHRNAKWDGFVQEGFKAYDSGNLGSAEMFLQRAIGRGCEDGLVYVKVGLYYETISNYQKALDYFMKAAKKLPAQYPGLDITRSLDEIIGRVYYVMKQKDKAEPYLKRSLEKGEIFTSLYFLGQYSREKGQLEDAIDYFKRAFVAKLPDGMSPNIGILIMSEIGKAYFQLKKFDESLVWWDKILSVEPTNQTARSYKDNIEKMKYKEQEQRILKEMIQ